MFMTFTHPKVIIHLKFELLWIIQEFILVTNVEDFSKKITNKMNYNSTIFASIESDRKANCSNLEDTSSMLYRQKVIESQLNKDIYWWKFWSFMSAVN